MREPDKKRKRAERGRQIQNALSQLAKARDLGVAEALNQIRDLEKEIKSLKEANNPIKRLTTCLEEFWKNNNELHHLNII